MKRSCTTTKGLIRHWATTYRPTFTPSETDAEASRVTTNETEPFCENADACRVAKA